jgi:hypothetical protein
VPDNFDPTYNQAISSPAYGKYWKVAIQAEWNQLFETKAVRWVLASTMHHRAKAITAKFVLKFKDHENRYKARCVLRGFEQRPGSYGDTFAPTVSNSTVKLVMAIGVKLGWDIRATDIKGAFLMADLPTEVYMQPPRGFERTGYVLRVERSLYGLKDAPALFNALLDKRLTMHGLTRSQLDPSLYFDQKRKLYVVAHVDDLLYTGPDNAIDDFEAFLKQHFKLTKAGTVTDFVGMQVKYDRKQGKLTLSQQDAVTKIVKDFAKYLPARRCTTPLQVEVRLIKPTEAEVTEQQQWENKHRDNPGDPSIYQSGVGRLMHLYTCTRPDLAFAISQLARFMSGYSAVHRDQLFHAIAYIRDCGEVKIVFNRNELPDNLDIETYADSDWGTDPDARRSCTGQIHLIGKTPIHWKSQMQSRTALGSGEAEFVAIGEATRFVLLFRQIMSELGLGHRLPTVIYSDAEAAINGLKTLKVDSNLKHVETRFHRTRDEIRHGHVELRKVPTKFNLADAFTKQLHGPQFMFLNQLACSNEGYTGTKPL